MIFVKVYYMLFLTGALNYTGCCAVYVCLARICCAYPELR
jgi:hypothetical protein